MQAFPSRWQTVDLANFLERRPCKRPALCAKGRVRPVEEASWMYGQSLGNSAPASCLQWHGGSSPRLLCSPYCGGVAVFHLLTLSAIFPCSIVFPLTARPEFGYAGLEAFCKLAQSLQCAVRLAARGREMYGRGGDARPLYLRRNRHGAWKGGSPGIKNAPHRSGASACQKPRKSARG